MRLSEIQNKDVVDVKSGKKIGNIIDVKIESINGKIDGLILEENKGFFKGNDEYEIGYHQIIRIGQDVILIDLDNKKDFK